MTSYRRFRVAGATYFFTVALADPGSTTLTDRIHDLRAAWAATLKERPFRCEAVVVLPNHLHAVWSLPYGDADFSTRWRLIKARFSRAVGGATPRRSSRIAKRERELWQRRFWEHCIRDRADLESHLRYCWLNPVWHGLVERASDWPHSSIQLELRDGRLLPDWSAPTPRGRFGEIA